MNKTEIKNYLYRQLINQLYYAYGANEILPGTTINLKWESTIFVTEKGAKLITKELKELDKIINI